MILAISLYFIAHVGAAGHDTANAVLRLAIGIIALVEDLLLMRLLGSL